MIVDPAETAHWSRLGFVGNSLASSQIHCTPLSIKGKSLTSILHVLVEKVDGTLNRCAEGVGDIVIVSLIEV